jgi:ribosomal-protein-alanine N-acetyltransferase
MMKVEDIFGVFPRLETERLILRKISLDDAGDIFEYAADPDVATYVSWEPHTSIEDSISLINSMIQRYEKTGVSEWGLVYKENKKCIGTCGYMWWRTYHARAEVGFALSKKYWNRGLMTEALREVITFGFEKMELNRIEARCFLANRASEKVMQKVGMKFEGIQREGLFAKGKYQDLKVYSILRKEYHGETELT